MVSVALHDETTGTMGLVIFVDPDDRVFELRDGGQRGYGESTTVTHVRFEFDSSQRIRVVVVFGIILIIARLRRGRRMRQIGKIRGSLEIRHVVEIGGHTTAVVCTEIQ